MSFSPQPRAFRRYLYEDEIRYSVSAPVDVRTKDVSDTLRLVAGGNVVVRWEEKRPR